MKVGVVVFPGSNCDRDALHAAAAGRRRGDAAVARDAGPAGADAVILPGGFAYGDYLRAGVDRALQPDHGRGPRARGARRAGARASATASRCWPRRACVPGALLRNASLRFEHRWVRLRRRAPRHAVHAGRPRRADAAHADRARGGQLLPARRGPGCAGGARRRRLPLRGARGQSRMARRATSPASSTSAATSAA